MTSQQRRSLLIQPFYFRIGGVLAKFIKVNVGSMQDPWFEKQLTVDGASTTEKTWVKSWTRKAYFFSFDTLATSGASR